MSHAQDYRILAAADRDARNHFASDLLAKRSFQVGFAQGLLRDVIAAADAPEDVRSSMMDYAVSRIRRELGENGRLNNG